MKGCGRFRQSDAEAEANLVLKVQYLHLLKYLGLGTRVHKAMRVIERDPEMEGGWWVPWCDAGHVTGTPASRSIFRSRSDGEIVCMMYQTLYDLHVTKYPVFMSGVASAMALGQVSGASLAGLVWFYSASWSQLISVTLIDQDVVFRKYRTITICRSLKTRSPLS